MKKINICLCIFAICIIAIILIKQNISNTSKDSEKEVQRIDWQSMDSEEYLGKDIECHIDDIVSFSKEVVDQYNDVYVEGAVKEILDEDENYKLFVIGDNNSDDAVIVMADYPVDIEIGQNIFIHGEARRTFGELEKYGYDYFVQSLADSGAESSKHYISENDLGDSYITTEELISREDLLFKQTHFVLTGIVDRGGNQFHEEDDEAPIIYLMLYYDDYDSRVKNGKVKIRGCFGSEEPELVNVEVVEQYD